MGFESRIWRVCTAFSRPFDRTRAQAALSRSAKRAVLRSPQSGGFRRQTDVRGRRGMDHATTMIGGSGLLLVHWKMVGARPGGMVHLALEVESRGSHVENLATTEEYLGTARDR